MLPVGLSRLRHRSGAVAGVRAALGADAALGLDFIGTGSPARDVANVELFARLAEEARAAGIPLGAEFYPAYEPEHYGPDRFHDMIHRVLRIASELGADFVKTFYTGPRFAEIVASTPVPIIVLGAGKEEEPVALKKAADSMAAGARVSSSAATCSNRISRRSSSMRSARLCIKGWLSRPRPRHLLPASA